jgi:NAD+ kinase
MSGQRIGIIGDERLREIVKAAGGQPVETTPTSTDTVDFLVTVGESALVDLIRENPDRPVLPVGEIDGFRSVQYEHAKRAIERLLNSAPPTRSYPIIAATGSFEPVLTLFDVGLVAAEPARISEFAVHSGPETVAQFRADGVVASTPAGSGGYNQHAGGPVIEPGTDVTSVVPIAPFATAVGHWVLPIDSVRLSVERDETPVDLLADGRRERTLTAGESVTLSRVGAFETHAIPDVETAKYR